MEPTNSCIIYLLPEPNSGIRHAFICVCVYECIRNRYCLFHAMCVCTNVYTRVMMFVFDSILGGCRQQQSINGLTCIEIGSKHSNSILLPLICFLFSKHCKQKHPPSKTDLMKYVLLSSLVFFPPLILYINVLFIQFISAKTFLMRLFVHLLNRLLVRISVRPQSMGTYFFPLPK